MNQIVVEKSEKIQKYLSHLLSLSIIVTFFASLLEKQWLVAFVCVPTFFSFYLPGILAKNLSVRLPTEFQFILSIFLYSAFFLGEVHNFYHRLWWWDVMLHAIAGVILGFAGFLILYTLYSQKRLISSAFTLALFSFCFALALGALWEIFEFTMDQVFKLKMQKSGLNDTMWDLIVDALGAFFAAGMGYLYVKFKKSPLSLFDRMLRKFLSQNRPES